jgi:anaerobic selenocysteine-containing dehydrogenase
MTTRTDYAQCMLCEAICGLEVEHDGTRVHRIRGDAQDPFSRGHICPKGVALAEIQNDPDRLRHPLVKQGGRFEAIDWEEALDLAARRIAEIQRRHGRDAVASYFGNPAAHSYSAILFYQLLMDAIGSRNRYSANSVDTLPRFLTSYELYGNQVQVPVPDLDRTDYFLMLGANPVVSNGSAMTAPDVAGRLRRLRERGGRLVVIDPRRTETADVADEHHFIRPGTDALFLAALLQVLLFEGLAKPGPLLPRLDGWDAVPGLVAPFPPERVAPATGISAEVTRRLARELAAAPTAVCYGRVGTCVQEFGTVATWLVDLVNVATGNLDRPGGWMFSTPAVDLPGVARRLGLGGSFDRWRSRVSGHPEFTGEFPVAALGEEIETPGEGQVRALLVLAGNPVLSLPNGGRLDRALAGLDFMVSIDIYLNETSRHAHLILPTTFGLEHAQYPVLFHAFAVRNLAHWSPAVLEKPPGLRHDWEVLVELADRIGRAKGGLEAVKGRLRGALGRGLGARRVLDLLLRLGPRRLSLAKLERAPHGLDLGPLEPRLAKLMGRRRIRVAPPRFVADLVRLERRLEAPARALVLVSRRTLRSNNSWNHNAPRLVSGKDRCVLEMHPRDAAERGIRAGQRVALASRVGKVVVPVSVTDAVMPGVVSLPHGWGHDKAGARLRVAATRPGASVNDVTDDAFVDALSGAASLSGVPVEVSPVEGEATPG